MTTIDRLLPTIRYDVKFESDRLRDLDLPGISPDAAERRRVEENAVPLAEFLDIPVETAREIAGNRISIRGLSDDELDL